MTEIKPNERLQEVMVRTMFNLRFVQEHATHSGPFEVVQLVNSFLGAMVHPWEELESLDPLGLRTLPLLSARERGWPVLEKELDTDANPNSYGQMLRWTRHGFAHGNIGFENREGQIASIRVWNCPPGRNRQWGSVASVADLENFLWFFQDLACGHTPKPVHTYPRIFAHAAD